MTQASLRHPLLDAHGLRHGFGRRGAQAPPGTRRPRQVHGTRVIAADWSGEAPEADAVVARAGGPPVAVVTADCLPLLAAAPDGSAVAAIHAGWRGLAAGVIAAGLDALADAAPGAALCAAIGPHIGPCCYEVDAPVVDALRARFAAGLDEALHPTRPDHWSLDLGVLARRELTQAGLAGARIGAPLGGCTRCDPERFHSYRRDGPRAGRLVHWIVPSA